MTNSFIDKLKKGMDNKEHILDAPKKDIKKPAPRAEHKQGEAGKKDKSSSALRFARAGEKSFSSLSAAELKIQQKPLKTESSSAKTKLLIKSELLNNNKPKKEKWFEEEGQLTVDIYQTETKLIIQSAVAGIKPGDLDITIEKDLIIIKGIREEPLGYPKEKKDYFVQECYWGPFSRKIVLPVEVNPGQAQASMKQGVLIIQLPKTLREKKRKIEIKE